MELFGKKKKKGCDLILHINPPFLQATSYQNAYFNNASGLGVAFTSLSLPLPGPPNTYNLVEGQNWIAVESHAWGSWAWQMAFDLRISGTRS